MPSTLGHHRDMSAVIFGEDSPATKFLDDKIAESSNGRDEPVIASDDQLLGVLANLHFNGEEGPIKGSGN